MWLPWSGPQAHEVRLLEGQRDPRGAGCSACQGRYGQLHRQAPTCSVSTDASGGPLNLMLRGDGQEIKSLVEMVSQGTGRAVSDKTGLTGRCDFDMRLDLQMMLTPAQKMGANVPAAAANIPQAEGSSLATAFNEQLGLKLES